jgi:predicted dienelactone hydrolase
MKTRPTLPLSLLLLAPLAQAGSYDPLHLAATELETLELTVRDADRDRDIPLKIYLPPATPASPAPLILFSHGLGGSNKGNAFLGEHWAARGYLAVFVQHPGSDESIWKDTPPARRIAAFRAAGNLPNFLLRAQDIPATLDQLTLWNEDPDHALAGRLALDRIGMSGHSFGAITTQALAGQCDPTGRARFTDPRIKAAIALSPSVPARGKPDQAFGAVKIPWLLMTGTEDVAELGGTTIGAPDVESRLAVYPALPDGDKFELVLHDGTHHAFTDHALLPGQAAHIPHHHPLILALTTAFWDTYLKDDPAARAWLTSESPTALMEPKDRWQKK